MVRCESFVLVDDITVLNICGETGSGCTTFLFERDRLFLTIPGYCLEDDGSLFRHHSAVDEVHLYVKGYTLATYIQFGPFPNETVCAADFGFEAYDTPKPVRHVAPVE